jgi:hypothetical protein
LFPNCKVVGNLRVAQLSGVVHGANRTPSAWLEHSKSDKVSTHLKVRLPTGEPSKLPEAPTSVDNSGVNREQQCSSANHHSHPVLAGFTQQQTTLLSDNGSRAPAHRQCCRPKMASCLHCRRQSSHGRTMLLYRRRIEDACEKRRSGDTRDEVE